MNFRQMFLVGLSQFVVCLGVILGSIGKPWLGMVIVCTGSIWNLYLADKDYTGY